MCSKRMYETSTLRLYCKFDLHAIFTPQDNKSYIFKGDENKTKNHIKTMQTIVRRQN